MKPDEWIEGIENEAKSVEDAKWARETKRAAWKALLQKDASYALKRQSGTEEQVAKWGAISLVSLPLVAFYGLLLEQMNWASLLTGILVCAGSLVVVGGLAVACGRGRKPIWVLVGLTLLGVILLGQVIGASRPVVIENASFLLMGVMLLAVYTAYFFSLGRLWLDPDVAES